MSVNDGGPVYPVSTRPLEKEPGYGHQDSATTWQYGGKSLRDEFAGLAMAAMLGSARVQEGSGSFASIADAAYLQADAMLIARAKVLS